MAKRIQSPSSINMYRQCPRKYYYRYIENRPTKPSIHLIRGSVAHKVLEDFYDFEFVGKEDDLHTLLMMRILSLLKLGWKDAKKELELLGLDEDELKNYYQETQIMLMNWFKDFWKRFLENKNMHDSDEATFKAMRPEREVLYMFEEEGIRGYIDVIEENKGEVHLMDYKTSSHFEITPDYRLQLSIYAYMYKKKHGVMPKKVGIYFLRHGTLHLDVDLEMINDAKSEIEQIHLVTETDNIEDYPLHPSALCKWSTGQCDYYDLCFKENNFFRK